MIRVDAEQLADVAVTGGVGYVPVTFTGLNDYRGWQLFKSTGGPLVAVDQSVHGNDYWQTDHDAASRKWRITFNVSLDSPDDQPRTTRLVLKRP